mmetsp:Transcript_3327/g.20761  ORF Transcript_3327/g.20761 Transcript_3327/m.20761 type:complete len:104 (-) Transcript_3327:1410-1721(-)
MSKSDVFSEAQFYESVHLTPCTSAFTPLHKAISRQSKLSKYFHELMAFMKRRLKPWCLFQHTMRVSLFLRVVDSLPHGAQKLKSVTLAFIYLFLRALPDIDAS